jgi:hypothetical protein
MEPTINTITDKTNYKHGDNSLSGDVIKKIFCSAPNSIVFETSNGVISWEYNYKNGDIVDRAAVKFHELREIIPNDLPDRVASNIKVSLCNVFFTALNSETISDCDNAYLQIEERIKNLKTHFHIKCIFILYSVLFTFLISSLSASLYFFTELNLKAIFICISCGCIGSLFSVMQRNDKVILDTMLDNKYIILQALFTAIMGSIAGGLIYIISKSGLALSFSNDNIYSLTILSVLGGFSERMIPEIFKKLETK